MWEKSVSGVLDIREAYLVKRRSFPDSSGRFTFCVSPFTNDEDGPIEHPAGVVCSCPRREGHRSSAVPKGMVDADGAKQCNAIHPVAGVFCQRVLAESALWTGPLVEQSLPAFIGPGAGAESNVAEVGGHEKVIIQNSSVRTMG